MQNVILCDLDGTLALNKQKRSWYDASTCDKDSLNEPVATVVRWAEDNGCKIIYLSGRESKYVKPTVRFLKKYGFKRGPKGDENYELIMRETGDNRPDYIIKRELYDQYIEPMNYNILFILDDRTQVVEMWRAMGLTVFQVAKGDF